MSSSAELSFGMDIHLQVSALFGDGDRGFKGSVKRHFVLALVF